MMLDCRMGQPFKLCTISLKSILTRWMCVYGSASPPSTEYSPVSDLPELRCKAPSGVGSGLDLVLKWHGIPLTINSWCGAGMLALIVRGILPYALNG
eukprot:1323747-Rhodomonas_salina.2